MKKLTLFLGILTISLCFSTSSYASNGEEFQCKNDPESIECEQLYIDEGKAGDAMTKARMKGGAEAATEKYLQITDQELLNCVPGGQQNVGTVPYPNQSTSRE